MSETPTLNELLDRVLIAIGHAALVWALLPVFTAALVYMDPAQDVVNILVGAYVLAVLAYTVVAVRDLLAFGTILGETARVRYDEWRSTADAGLDGSGGVI